LGISKGKFGLEMGWRPDFWRAFLLLILAIAGFGNVGGTIREGDKGKIEANKNSRRSTGEFLANLGKLFRQISG